MPGCQLSVCSLLSLQTFAGLAGVCFNIYFDKTISVDDRLSLLCLNSLNCRDKSSSRTWKRVGATLYLSLFVATNCQSGNYKIAFNWTARRIVKVFDGNIFFQKLKHWIIFFGLYTFINKVTSGKFSPIRMSLSFFFNNSTNRNQASWDRIRRHFCEHFLCHLKQKPACTSLLAIASSLVVEIRNEELLIVIIMAAFLLLDHGQGSGVVPSG